jgi:hypothetical protein
MHRDPIVEEVRRHREARAAKFGFDVRAILEDARKRQATSGHVVVNLEGKVRVRKAGQSRPASATKRAYRRGALKASCAKG